MCACVWGEGKGEEGGGFSGKFCFALNVIMRSLVYFFIRSTLRNVPSVSYFSVFILCSVCFYVNIIAEKECVIYKDKQVEGE